ncbi:hypothetical protein [Arcticibacterium luteifluviistationis]|uniref:CopG family transcriptional regulator n=1 Tax=Arcticibacterium luteifluviistationis TaxID=1784714 RepID=A0A2Z4G6E8_9BACT|nr:hypothetical protein [Arcticibacterium luteifluviistationis]AWV96716.1 hypothetical protein DJ013_00315 [Arcticibacterium luteifluviistationis]
MKESKSKKVSFRLSESLFNELKLEADEKELTLSKWIIDILEQRPQKKEQAESSNWLLAVISLVLMLVYIFYVRTRRVFK